MSKVKSACKMSKVKKSKKGQKFQSRDKIPKSESTVGWGCKTSSLQTNCFVTDNTETQLIRHIALFHAIKENRTNLNNFEVSFLFTLKFCAILDKNCSKNLHVKIEKVARSCNIKLLETSQNIELHRLYFKYLRSCKKVAKTCPTYYVCTFLVKGACTCIFCFHQTPWNLVLSVCWVLLFILSWSRNIMSFICENTDIA